MKTLVIIQNSIKTTCLFRVDYIRQYLASGGAVTVIAPNDCQTSLQKLRAMGVKAPHILAPTSLVRKLLAVAVMNLYVLKERGRGQDKAFICHFLVTYLSVFLSLVPFSKQVFLSIEGLGSLYREGSLLSRVIKWMINRDNVVRIFCNNSERELVGKPCDWVAGGVGVDIEYFKPEATSADLSAQFTLLYVGRLIGDKGAYDAVEVFKQLCCQRNDVNMVMVGDIYPNNPSSFSNADIAQLKQEFGDRLTFVGYSADPRSWYQKADILLLPSKREGFPVCVMEASAMGVPSVCFKVPGCEDAIRDGENGYLAPYGDIKTMTELVSGALNPEVRDCLKQSSRAYACSHFAAKEKSSALLSYIFNQA